MNQVINLIGISMYVTMVLRRHVHKSDYVHIWLCGCVIVEKECKRRCSGKDVLCFDGSVMPIIHLRY